MWHRLWVCPAVDYLRKELRDPEVLQASSEVDLAAVSNDKFVLFTKGIFTHPCEHLPTPSKEGPPM
eukprot:3168568-Pyramimonas_sp.AAC.1